MTLIARTALEMASLRCSFEPGTTDCVPLCHARRVEPVGGAAGGVDHAAVGISVSIGLTGWQSVDEQHAHRARVDRALDRAKQAGRDPLLRA